MKKWIPLTSRYEHDGQEWPITVAVAVEGAFALWAPDEAPFDLYIAAVVAGSLIRNGLPLDDLDAMPDDFPPLTLAMLRVARSMELAGAGIVAHVLGLSDRAVCRGAA